MEIKINFSENSDTAINNLAFVRALMINKRIENLSISYEEKEKIKKEVLEYLKIT